MTLTKQEKEERATNIISELGLERCQDSMIGGSYVRGISGGEKKRVCIGNEIIMNPSLLFLDEPTFGLDSTTALRIIQVLQDIAETKSPSKAAGMFSGTQDKCATCGKTAYPLEKVTVENQSYHKTCFKCCHGGCYITPSNYAALEGNLYCKHHFSQLFKEKGSYTHLLKSASVRRPAASVPEA